MLIDARKPYECRIKNEFDCLGNLEKLRPQSTKPKTFNWDLLHERLNYH